MENAAVTCWKIGYKGEKMGSQKRNIEIRKFNDTIRKCYVFIDFNYPA